MKNTSYITEDYRGANKSMQRRINELERSNGLLAAIAVALLVAATTLAVALYLARVTS